MATPLQNEAHNSNVSGGSRCSHFMDQKTNTASVWIEKFDDPDSELACVPSEDVDLRLQVATNYYVGIYQVDRLAKALARYTKPNWRLILDIGSNELNDVPESVCELANLEELALNNNKIRTLSSGFAKLVNLKLLRLDRNLFGDFPEAVCRLEQLKELNFRDCYLSSLPSSFASFHNLKELDLAHNAFYRFPEVICELRNLHRLWMNGNNLSSLPESLVNLQGLRELYIASNRFGEFPQVVCRLVKLEKLGMSNNQLSELPLAITKLTSLNYLGLSANRFAGLPLFLGDLPRLSDLRVEEPSSILLGVYASNPLQGQQSNLDDDELLQFFQQRKEIARLSSIVAGGFGCNESNPWNQFLVKGIYDPRLFIFIFDFAFDLSIVDPALRKKLKTG